MEKLLTDKAEALAAITRRVERKDDWFILVTPDEVLLPAAPLVVDGVATALDESGARFWTFATTDRALLQLGAALAKFKLSGVPDNVAEKATVNFRRDNGEVIEIPLKEFLRTLSEQQIRQDAERLQSIAPLKP